ncbi:transmembrane protein 120B isoform X5 [Sus scrofa]|uniref:transmembrane protein 120B isoform X5 n=1 Tax=Sus scrofa TaxID=9823 RepID=UPI000A2B1B9D|nr:transmembrane protein 120B isoform X5 [Sus scrofa]
MPGACLPERGWGGSRGGGCDVRCARGSGCAGTAGASEGGRRADWREVLVARRATLREPPPPPRTAAPCPASWSVASASGMSWRENFRNCRYKRHASQEEAELVQQLGANIKERQNVFFDMEAYLPKKNGLYLNLVLGNVNVTLLSKQAKFAYKDEYEKFKLYLTIILLLGAVACRFVLHYRVTDEIFNFLLVWYYCTLTIRESILISNGSRIKGWWVSHHYVSTFLSGVMLTWLCPVPAVLLPEGLPLPAAGAGGEESLGPHSGRIPVLDVARPHLPSALPVLWPFLAALQCRHVI